MCTHTGSGAMWGMGPGNPRLSFAGLQTQVGVMAVARDPGPDSAQGGRQRSSCWTAQKHQSSGYAQAQRRPWASVWSLSLTPGGKWQLCAWSHSPESEGNAPSLSVPYCCSGSGSQNVAHQLQSPKADLYPHPAASIHSHTQTSRIWPGWKTEEALK